MIQVLNILEVLCESHEGWTYSIRKHYRMNNEVYSIMLLTDNESVIISSTLDADEVIVYANGYSKTVLKKALLEYVLYLEALGK